MRVLVACEESQEVTAAFTEKGNYAMSCDLNYNGAKGLPHYRGNVFDIIGWDWDLMIAFPPCTHLAVSGAAWFEQKRKDGRQQEGIDLFLKIANVNIPKVAIENPIGIMSKLYRKPDQIIHPYYFGDTYQKSTCLWLKGLPKLYHNKSINLFDDNITHVDKGEFGVAESGKKMSKWFADAWKLPKEERSKVRSKTFSGIAKAMANQWS